MRFDPVGTAGFLKHSTGDRHIIPHDLGYGNRLSKNLSAEVNRRTRGQAPMHHGDGREKFFQTPDGIWYDKRKGKHVKIYKKGGEATRPMIPSFIIAY